MGKCTINDTEEYMGLVNTGYLFSNRSRPSKYLRSFTLSKSRTTENVSTFEEDEDVFINRIETFTATMDFNVDDTWKLQADENHFGLVMDDGVTPYAACARMHGLNVESNPIARSQDGSLIQNISFYNSGMGIDWGWTGFLQVLGSGATTELDVGFDVTEVWVSHGATATITDDADSNPQLVTITRGSIPVNTEVLVLVK